MRKIEMKNRKKYFVAEYVTDIALGDVEQEIFYADSKQVVVEEMRRFLGGHLLAIEVREATWTERREFKKSNTCIEIA